MKALLISSLAFAILAGGASAETPPPPGPPPVMGAKAPSLPPSVPEGRDEGAVGPPPPEGRRGPPPPPPSKAAHFRIERGDTVVDVKCDDDQSTKTCGDFTLQLLDRVELSKKP
jgi:hypothetical protein